MTDLARPTDDLDRAKHDLGRLGYCLVAGALDPERLAAVRDRLVEQAAGEVAAGVAYLDTGGRNQRVWNLVNKGADFTDLLVDPLYVEMITHVLGEGWLVSSSTANIAGPGGHPMYLHADQGYVPRPWPPYPLVANLAWLVDEFSDANGATRVVPGSHLWERGVGRGEEPPTVPVEAPAGSALVFDGRLLHGTGANRTDARRHVILNYACRPFLRQQENFTVSVSPEVLAGASDELLARLGFRVQGTLGGVQGPTEGALMSRPTTFLGPLAADGSPRTA
jgi:ectoine hydroxylase-related dioxygenase (phytanoyl-CoA dioxygenase family)